jgi:hypothetical protein
MIFNIENPGVLEWASYIVSITAMGVLFLIALFF